MQDQGVRHCMIGELIVSEQFTIPFGDGEDMWVITSSIYVVVDSIEGGNDQNGRHSRPIIRGVNKENKGVYIYISIEGRAL